MLQRREARDLRTVFDDGYAFEEKDDPRTLKPGELVPDCRAGIEENDEDFDEPEGAPEDDE